MLDETVDPTYGAASVTEMAKRQSQLIQHFQSRWKREYLTSLREYHRCSEVIKVGDIVIIHDDAPRAGWKLAVVEKLITGSDGVTRAGEIRTARGTTNRPIVRLIPLEVNEQSETRNWTQVISQNDSEGIQVDRPTRLATLTARNKIKQWTDEIRAAPEDVMD